MREVITLQLGQKSNYFATHFWNTQESYFTYSSDQESLIDHDIHFRPGIGIDGTETFTPRTLIYDLKGGFGSLRKINALYELEEPAVPEALWNGPAVVQRQGAIEQSAYQQSLAEGLPPPQLTKESVRYWSDFNRVYFHPKSIIQLNEYELSSAIMPFENWNAGEELFNSLDKEHDLLDRDLRPFAEEADQMQGIQLMTGADDAWGGFAARYMDRLRDEYGKTTIWLWGLEDEIKDIPREKRFLKLSNTARSLSEIASQASLFIPMALPLKILPSYVTLDRRSYWHVSGLMSTAMESMTLASRLKSQNKTLDTIAAALNVNGNQNIAKLRMGLDKKSLSITNGHHRPGRLDVDPQSRDSRAPSQDRSTGDIGDGNSATIFDMEFFPSETTGETLRTRNIKKAHVFGQSESYRADEDLENQEANEEDQGFERARRRAAGLPIIYKTQIPLSFPLLDSFPHIFAPADSASRWLSVNTSLSTDTSVALRVKYLQHVVARSVNVDEREALFNTLGGLAEAYEEGWDSGTDEDDD
ncbi:hypothetical protein B7494_g3904 [Chlorociboria aeruginascens]|nr:hypothetical protein B7494_g3904 [Chlorociboria aeruginascens]